MPARTTRGALRRAAAAASLASVACFAPPALGLDPTRPTTQYVRSLWTEDQGLPQNTVNAIVQTRDGYLWLGTEEGLVRFDGARFTVFDRRNTPEIRNSFVMALHEDRAGDLWVGTFGGGLLRLRQGRFRSFTTADGLPSERIRAIHEDRAGTIWVATGGGGLAKYEDGRFSTLSAKNGLGDNRVWSLAEDPRGRLFVGTYGGGVNRVEKGRFSSVPLGAAPGAALVRPMCVDGDGRLWVGTDGAGLFRVDGDEVRSFGPSDGLPSLSIRSLWPDRDGNLWVGTDGAGLHRYRDGRFSPFGTKEGLPSDVVLSLHEDREGSLWIGTSGGGLARLRDGRVTTLTVHDGLQSELVRTVLEGRNGVLWAGTTGGGLTRFENGQATTLRAADGLGSDLVFALHEDRGGRLWVGTDGGGVSVLEKGGIRRFTHADGLVNDRVRTLCEGEDGSIYIGTVSGLSRWKDGRFESFTPKEGLPGNSVRILLPGRDGSLWIGTDGGGLGQLAGGRFRTWRDDAGLSSNRVFALHEDERGVLWVGTSGGGLNRLSGGRLKAITSADGLHDDVVFQILDDGTSLWMSCNRGIFRVSRDQLDRFAEGRLERVESHVFGRGDGMRSAECNGGSPAGALLRDGRLLFPTVKGIAVIDPSRMQTNLVPPLVLVEGLRVDGRPFPATANLRLPPGSARLELSYTATSLRVPEKVLFRTRLEGFETEWVEAGTTRAATFTNLKPGPYTFRVAACNDDGLWNERGATFSFSIAPYFWQTWWFLALCVAAALSTAFGIHRLRIRRLEARERQLEQIVSERTLELKQRSEELQRAQEQMEKLTSTTSGVLEDPAAWARSVAREMARAIGAAEIGIWLVEEGSLVALAPTRLAAPDDALLRRSLREEGVLDGDSRLVVPVLGMTGEARGVLVVEGPASSWGEVPRRVIGSLARHLGTALDLRALKERLVTSDLARVANRREMHEHGVRLAAVCPACRGVFDDAVALCPRDGLALDWSRLLPLRPAGRYLLLRWLGEGGMGTVFHARDERLGREVVVKVIRPDGLRDAGTRLRFAGEARIVAQIRHPGVIEVFDTGELEDGSAFLVMEYLPGMSLADVLDLFGPGRPAQVARLARHVGGALHAAHEAGVVHRDVKPGNVFLVPGDGGFQGKVLDFGVAKSQRFEGPRTRTGLIVGTPAYMAPEQVLGKAVDARSDLFAFAAVLHEALSGERLVPEGDLSRTFAEILHQPPPPLAGRVAGLSAEVDAVFGLALAKRPEDRPATVLAFVERLAALLEAVPADPTGPHGWPTALPETTPTHRTWSPE